MSEGISSKMSSAGLLGGVRGSVGRSAQSPLQSLFGQNGCAPGVDRENERSVRSHAGSVDWQVPSSAISSVCQSAPRCTRNPLANDAALRSGFTRCSGIPKCLSSTLPRTRNSSSTRFSSQSCTGHASFTRSANPALLARRGLNSTFSGVTVLPNIAGGVSPLWQFHSTGSRDGKRGPTAMASQPDEGEKVLSNREYREAAEIQMMKEWTARQYQSPPESEPDSSWEPMNMIMRVAYAVAMYGALVVAGNALCTFTGVDCWGGFKLDIETFGQALLWAIPPIMALSLILEDEVVKICPPARAIRDVEDEELIDFFVGMKPWQFIFVVAAGSLSEELFFRVAIQGGLAHALQYTAKGPDEVIVGVSALTTIVPFFTPFAQAFAAVLTASITGSMYYIISCPKDPEYVIAPVSVNKYARNNRRDIKRRISAWYERRQLKKIYSTLMEALLALYLGFEWVQTGNIFGPMITHTLYSLVVAGNGLRRIHDNRHKLRQRVVQVMQQKEVKKSDVAAFFDKMN